VVYEHMAQTPQLVDYLELRVGTALDQNDLATMLQPEVDAGNNCVCVDWLAVDDRLFLLTIRPGEMPVCVQLDLNVNDVRTFVHDYLDTQSFRQTLRDMPELLDNLNPLIAPLADLSAPDELLICVPTGSVHAVPLHALSLAGTMLLERNPVVYSPSLTVLRHCLARYTTAPRIQTATLLGDPSEDRVDAATLVSELARQFDTSPLLGNAVTRTAFIEAVTGAAIVHFQGHAVHSRNDPLQSYLALADGRFTARDIFHLMGFQPELVTLAACESAANVIMTGDEPLGLIPAFLYAGAGAVVATLWPVHSSTTALVMKEFYGLLQHISHPFRKAEALRQALLAVRVQAGQRAPYYWAPYYWAPFVVYGDWH